MEVAAPRLATFDSLPWRQVCSRFAAMLHFTAPLVFIELQFVLGPATKQWISFGVRKAGLFLQPVAGRLPCSFLQFYAQLNIQLNITPQDVPCFRLALGGLAAP